MSDKISVIMTAFNQEKYIKSAIDSILNQNYDNFDLIIVDDGSTDKTRNIIDSYHDKRIRKIFKTNGGPSDATNVGIKEADGEWIALMSGDDISIKDRLESEVSFANCFGYNVVFGLPEIVDENENKIDKEEFSLFFKKHSSKNCEVFRDLFCNANYFCAPTALIKRSILVDSGLEFNVASLQLQDFEMWLKLSTKNDMPIMKKKVIKYRQHTNNLSSPQNNKRMLFELQMVYRNALNGLGWDFLHEIFPDNFSFESKEDMTLFEIEKTFLYLAQNGKAAHLAGCERMWYHLNDKKERNIVNNRFRYTSADYFKDTGAIVN